MPDGKPGQSYNVGGTRPTGRYRVRPTLFGCTIEQLWESRDGTQRWEKIEFPVEISIDRPAGREL